MAYKIFAREVAAPFSPMLFYSLAEIDERVNKIAGFKAKSSLQEVVETNIRWCLEEQNTLAIQKKVFKKLAKKQFYQKVVKESYSTLEKFKQAILLIRKQNFKKFTAGELAQSLDNFIKIWIKATIWGHIINMSDFHFNLLSAKLIKLITERIKKNKIKVSTAEVFAVLTTPLKRSLLLEQDLNMLKLLKEIQKNKDLENSFRQNKNLRAKLEKSSLWPKIKAHTKKYDWLQYHYLGPTILSVNYFIELLQGLVKQKVKAEENLKDLMNKEKETEEKQEELKDKLKFTSSELYWIEMAKEFIYLKGYRKDLTFMACRSYEDLLKEMAKRFDISLKQLQFMTLEEILDGLRNNNYPNPDLLNERFKYCVIYYPQGKAKVYVGKKARKMAEKIKEEKISEKLREFKGTPAFPGKATGKVIKVFNSKDMSKMKEKRILVSPATNPNIMPAITKAAAIITDEGGITCHAAIVSRELKIPCVIGTKIATQVLKDGDKVEVDAEQGIVKIL